MMVPPSYHEGLPKVLIEADACCRAAVTINVLGCRHAVDAGVTGVPAPSKAPALLADAMNRLIVDRVLCDAMGLAGRKRAVQVFDVNAVVNMHLNIYRALGECL